MFELDTPLDARNHLNEAMEPSEWVTISQEMINRFAEATGDHQWIHVDIERAKREMPGGVTIAHGFLILSLIPRLAGQVFRFRKQSQVLNYGSDRVRFISPVPVGARVRLRSTFKTVEQMENGGVRIVAERVIEIEGEERPAIVADTISLVFP